MQFRDHPGVQGKRDTYPFDPRLLKIDPNYNVRDLDSQEERPDLDELKELIRPNGVKTPLEVRLQGDDVFIVAGHRRHKVVMELIEEGEDIKSVPVIPEPKGTNEADRVVNLIVSNSGKPLKPLQIAEVVRRLTAFGWDKGQIAKRLGWKTTGSVNNYLDMLAMPEAVKEQVRQGDVSATVARQIVKETAKDAKDDPDFAAELIRKNKEENALIKGKDKSHKVTQKSLKRGKADKLPVPARAQRQSELTAKTPQQEPEQQPVVAAIVPMIGPVPVSRDFAQHMHDVHNAREGVAADTKPDSRPSQPAAIKDLLAALKPFADLCNDFDANAKADDDIVEVLFADIKKAWSVYTAATGGSEEAQEEEAA